MSDYGGLDKGALDRWITREDPHAPDDEEEGETMIVDGFLNDGDRALLAREHPYPPEEPLPAATARPCDECPFRRNSAKGWLGPLGREEWMALVKSDLPIACHKTIVEEDSWEGASQCRGAAIMRANVMKSPRNPEVVVGPVDREAVFAWYDEFEEHHDSLLADALAKQREQRLQDSG